MVGEVFSDLWLRGARKWSIFRFCGWNLLRGGGECWAKYFQILWLRGGGEWWVEDFQFLWLGLAARDLECGGWSAFILGVVEGLGMRLEYSQISWLRLAARVWGVVGGVFSVFVAARG